MSVQKDRKKFFKDWANVGLNNLIDIQINSYDDFLQKDVYPEKRKKQGLQELFEEIFPIVSYDENTKIEFISYRFATTRYSVAECLERGITYEAALHAAFSLHDEAGVREEEVFMGFFPMMTEEGSFIINGSERVIVSQIHRSPGIYFEKDISKTKKEQTTTLSFKIMPYRGSWLVAELGANDIIYIYMERNKKRKRVLATTFLRAIGISRNVDIFEKFFNIVKASITESDVDSIVGNIAAKPVHDKMGSVIIKDGENLTTAGVMAALREDVKEIDIIENASSSDPIIKMIRADTIDNHKDALKHCFRKMHPDEPATISNARFGLMRFFFDKNRYSLGKVGRYKINKRLGLPVDDESLNNVLLTQNDIVLAIKKLLAIKNKQEGEKVDDIDDLSNRRIRLCGELVANQCRLGFVRMEKVIKEKLSAADASMDSLIPGRLISSKMMTVVLKELFARSQLSQFMDQSNPLASISHKRRISALGTGGIQRERAGLEVRDVHHSHYGRICPVETPEGPSIGLITSLAVYARVNRFGFIETPYFVVKDAVISKGVVYLAYDEEVGKNIVQSTVDRNSLGEIIQVTCLARRDGEIIDVSKNDVNLIEVSPSQIFSAGTNLIPFLEHDDTNRALMGSNMQRQAVPVLVPEAPIVGTGLERKIAKDAGAVISAPMSGEVVYVDGQSIRIKQIQEEGQEDLLQKECIVALKKFKRSNNGMCLNYKPTVKIGDKVNKGDIISDGPCASHGELALGKNARVAFMPFYGFNFEDAIVVSENVVKKDVFTAIRIEKLEIVARDTKLGQEEITRDIPNVSEESVKNLDEHGIIKVGSRVRVGDIIVGKITPKLEGDLSPEERFLRAIFKDKAQNVKDTSLVAPVGIDGVVVDVKVFSRKDRVNRTDDMVLSESEKIKTKKKSFLSELSEVKEKGKEAIYSTIKGRSAPEVIVHRTTGEILVDSKEVITAEHINALIDVGSNNILDINIPEYIDVRNEIKILEDKIENLEIKHKQIVDEIKKGDPYLDSGVLKHIVVYVARKSPLEIGDKMAGRHGNKGVISTIVSVEDMPFTKDGEAIDIVLNPLGVPSRMNIGQLAETRLGLLGHKTNQNMSCPVFRGCKDAEAIKLLQAEELPIDGKEVLYNGKTGDRFINRVVIGYMYMLRLNHFIADKMHARATGPYSFITQQPLGGKSRFGGQRFGEMEFWAAEAYGAAYFLLEMLTVKSDDVVGRAMIYQNIVKGEPVLKTTQTESLRVLTKEIMGLCLDVRLENTEEKSEEYEPDEIITTKSAALAAEDQSNKFDRLTLRLASEDVIRNVWSHGEVKKAETINYRTMRPERGGLFCEKIFGPTKDWECACGKHKKIKHKGIICDRCGVEVNVSRVRRERMGHIDLAIPIVHIWLLKNVPSRLGHLLGMQVSQLESIIYYEQYVVIDPKSTNLQVKQLLSHQAKQEYTDRYGEDAFEVCIGGAAIKALLKIEDLKEVEQSLKLAVKQARSVQARMKLARRLRTIDGFLKSNNSLDSLVLTCIPVIPPDIRPLIKLEGGRFATSDINDLYRRLLYRNERLKQIMKMRKTPEVIVRNEMRLLQEAGDGVFDNGKRNTAIAGAGNKILKPLAQSLRGKHGRFRQNMLGKRVDYSGRSVIVVGPELKINQCGLPKDMAIQMFEPFIVRQLRITGRARTVRSARRIIQKKTKEVWEIIESVTKNHTVVLNRAPTLHRLSIQAFKPVLVEGKAIRLHPLACTAFNADFDGDQMAVHLPLSVEAQTEARLFMMAADNIFLPSSGKPVAMPTRDMTLGVYSLMIDPLYSPENDGKPLKTFSSREEVLVAVFSNSTEYQDRICESYENEYLGYGIFLHEKIAMRESGGIIYTTPGRVLFNSVVPEELGFQNYVMSQSKLSDLIMLCYKKLGLERAAIFLDELKDIGFLISTDFAISMGLEDICKPTTKKVTLVKAEKKVNKINEQLESGIITEGEAESRVIGAWTSASDTISEELFTLLEKIDNYKMNPLNVILASGARGNKSQIRQLGGMRGLVAKPSGAIIPSPIRGSFREGLNTIEFFISTHGGRKGLADTALKTADAGYLTRRLVDVAQEIIVRTENCGVISGTLVSSIQSMNEELLPIRVRIKGRYPVKDVIDTTSNVTIVSAGEIIDDHKAELIEAAGIKSVEIRSPLTCLTERGVCAKCYGINLADGKPAALGEAVGILAAQSIGEPGTQLTMRTFHLGGVASTEIIPEWVAEKPGVVIFDNLRYVYVEDDGCEVPLLVGRRGFLHIVEDTGHTHDEYARLLRNNTVSSLQSFKAEIGTKLTVAQGERVLKGIKLAKVETDNIPIIAEQTGKVVFVDLVQGVTTEKVENSSDIIIKHYSAGLCPMIKIVDNYGETIGSYHIPTAAVLSVQEGQIVKVGENIARIPRSSLKTQDITGGLARVAEIFEARKPVQPAEIAGIEGIIEFKGIQKGKRVVAIVDTEDAAIEIEQTIPLNKQLIVHNGDRVYAGQQLTNGIASVEEILKICGVKYLQRQLVDQVQEIYKLQGVEINDKHIEIIIRRMMNKMSIVDHGDASGLIFGDEITIKEFEEINQELIKSGGRPAKAKPILSGITQASLNTKSLISAASFQNPTQGLLEGAIRGSVDDLVGCKENIIMANKIPAGTGFNELKHGSAIEKHFEFSEDLFEDSVQWINKIRMSRKNIENLITEDVVLEEPITAS